jgi:hypothetical protein
VTEKMLTVSDSSTPTEQAGNKCFSQVMRGHVCNASSLERGFIVIGDQGRAGSRK